MAGLDDISLILAKAYKSGFLQDIKEEERAFYEQEALRLFGDDVALSATFVPTWKPTTAYALGQPVVNPSGDVVTAIAAFTSGATYNAVNWNLPATYAQKSSLPVNVLSYGAKADCVYVDQRGAGKWGVSTGANTFAATSGTTFGKGFKDSGFTQAATDNTTAFRAAFDALLLSGAFGFRNQVATLTGYRAARRELYIPAGFYYIDNAAALFSCLRQSPSGVQTGIRIKGDGEENTVLFVRIPTSGATDYMFYDIDQFQKMAIEGITIICTTGTERIVYQNSTTGQTGRWKLHNVSIIDYKAALTFDGTTNADRWQVNGCTFSTKTAGATLVASLNNSQVVAHDFTACGITHYNGGNVFDLGAGGMLKITGGSGEIYGLNSDGAAGRFIRIQRNGANMGYQADPAFIINGFRLELHDDSALIDTNAEQVVFRDCAVVPISNTRMANGIKQHVVIRGQANVRWYAGMFGDLDVALSTSLSLDYPYSSKAHFLLAEAEIYNQLLLTTKLTLYTDASDGLTTVFNTTGTGGNAIGRVQIEGCYPINSSYETATPTHYAVNGAPHNTRAWFGRPAKIHRAIHKVSSPTGVGLPDETKTCQIIIPPNCELIRVGIVKQATQIGIGSNSRTWRVKDGNNVEWAALTALGTAANVKTISADINQIVTSAGTTFTLSCDAGSTTGTYAEGYFFVDYI